MATSESELFISSESSSNSNSSSNSSSFDSKENNYGEEDQDSIMNSSQEKVEMQVNYPKVVVHSDKFHADEVTACAILHIIFGGLEEIIRTRDLELIKNKSEEGYYIIDVGREYDATRLRFDHHQSTFNKTFDRKINSTIDTSSKIPIKLSSCGLIYEHLGRQLIDAIGRQFYPEKWDQLKKKETSNEMDYLYQKVYNRCIQELDAMDNGVNHLKKEYQGLQVFNYLKYNDLNSIISRYNYRDTQNHEKQLENFWQAVYLAKDVLERHIVCILEETFGYWEAMEKIENPILSDLGGPRIHPEILTLQENFNYANALKTYDPNDQIKFVILPRDEKDFQIHTKNIPGTFDLLVPILPFTQAKELLGSNLVFVHNNRFIAVTKTLESAQQLALASLNEYNSWKNQLFRNKNWIIGSGSFMGLGLLGWLWSKK